MKKLLAVLSICLCIGGFSACNLDGLEFISSDTVSAEQSVDNSIDSVSSSSLEDSAAEEESSSVEEVHTHEWDEELGLVTTAPTCETAGVKTFTCACGYTETQEIPVLGHDYENRICTTCGGQFYSEGLEYDLTKDGLSYLVAGIGSCTDQDIVIPSIYNNLPVTRVEYRAFYGCRQITSLEIPDSVTHIVWNAFQNCSELNAIYYNGDIESWCQIEFIVVESYAIGQNNYLYINNNLVQNLVIPDTVTAINARAFYDCPSITSVAIPDSVTSIGEFAFAGCNALTSVVMSDSVTSIANGVFENCNLLTSIVIPETVTGIGSSAFYNCASLTSVIIPDSVTSIGRDAFSRCTSLTSITFGDTSNWYRTNNATGWEHKADGTLTSVTDVLTNVAYFTDTYDDYYWYKL